MIDKTFQVSCFVPERALHSSYTTIIDQNLLGCIRWGICLNAFYEGSLKENSTIKYQNTNTKNKKSTI
jgi:hypothetical protein